MSVYGNLLTAFPELYRTIQVWTAADKSDTRTVTGVFLPTKGDALSRWKFSNRGSATDYKGDDWLFISVVYKDKVKEGDYFYSPDDGTICRIMGGQDFRHEGGFVAYRTERVTGADHDQTERLNVKEATFA